MLGHSGIGLTADTYVSVLPDLACRAAEATIHHVLTAAKPPAHGYAAARL
ncbi:hypothetical protein [Amycolatopsis sp. MtRt-6]|nr:hypothetical protein [Amycolatopsis sp. MtRt-6]